MAPLNVRSRHAAAWRAARRVHFRLLHRSFAIAVRLCHCRAGGRVRVAHNGGGATCRRGNRHDVFLLLLNASVHLRSKQRATRVGPPLLLLSSNSLLLPQALKRFVHVNAANVLSRSSSLFHSTHLIASST